MDFVLVPVPAEHVLAIMKWVLFRAETDQEGEGPASDHGRVISLVVLAEPELRLLLGAIAEAAIRNEPIRLRDLADDHNLSSEELNELIIDLNQTVLDPDRALIEVSIETAVGVSGNTGQISLVSMQRDFALLIRHELRRQTNT